MNRIFKATQAWLFSQQIRQSFVPGQRRQPARMPVIPLRSKRTFRKSGVSFREQIQRHVDDVRAIELNWVVVANVTAAVFVLLCGICVVHFSYQNRQQVIELSELRSDRDQLLQNWTYLMRDQNQLSEFSRIESTAIRSMDMHRPEKKDIYVMKKSVHSKPSSS